MKRQILIVLVALAFAVALSSIAQAIPDNGELRPFMQPDSSIFLGRGFGDEFLHRFETEDGYTFVKNYADHWYYYAQQDGQGDLVPTEWMVGTVDPESKGIPPHLDFGEARKEEAKAVRDSVNAERVPEPIFGPVTLGVILIEFPDIPHHICQYSKKGYSLTDFDNLFFSDEVYTDLTPRCDPLPRDQVSGSMNDYWQEVSYGNIYLWGNILNPDDGSGHPIWYMADSCSDYYDLGGGNLYAEAMDKAEAAGFPASAYENLCILYAGDFNDMFWGLWPHASGNHYYMSEVWGINMGGNIVDYYFNHIGVHCHEFGHLLGLHDKYDYPGEPGNWDLMGAWGPYEGPPRPDVNKIPGACPAHINAWSKWKLGWLEPTFVDTILPDQLFYPVETHPQAYFYKVRDKEYFMAEYRTKFSGTHFDYYAYPAPDPSTDGLLIWHMVRSGHSFYWETVERADNSYDNPTGDLWPGTTGKDAFTPVSSPNTGGYPSSGVEEDSLLGRQPVATGLATEGITLHSEPLSIDADLYNNRWAGDIFRPTVWSGLQYVLGDVTVWVKPITIPDDTFHPEPKLTDTDSALVVKPGTYVRLSYQTALEIKGAFIAEGTADSMITFTSAAQNPEDGDWGGIIFYKESADSISLLKHCDISYGSWALVCLSSSPSISFCNSYNNRTGIICCDSSFSRIDTCSVYDNVHWGVWCCNGSSPVIHRCSIYGNGDYGLLNDDSTVTVLADSNWWGGDTTGPYDPSPGPPDYNPDGKGDRVSDYVIYRPWRKYGGVGVDEPQSERALPDHFSLSQNYPNPFNPLTQIQYALPKDCWVRLEVYNILGQRVVTLVDGRQKAGYKTVRWDASGVASGIYIYRIQAGDFVQSRRMILLN